jgi:hypothetical protein
MTDRRQCQTVAQNFWYALPLCMNLIASKIGIKLLGIYQKQFQEMSIMATVTSRSASPRLTVSVMV